VEKRFLGRFFTRRKAGRRDLRKGRKGRGDHEKLKKGRRKGALYLMSLPDKTKGGGYFGKIEKR